MKQKRMCQICFESPTNKNSFTCKDCPFSRETDDTSIEELVSVINRKGSESNE